MPDALESLLHLAAEARGLANDHPCTRGHAWATDGGRQCPHADDDQEGCGGSQTVYRCTRCGEYDYGDPGGPGHADCATFCTRTTAAQQEPKA